MMSSTQLYYAKQLISQSAQQSVIPMWIFPGAIAFMDMALVISAFSVSESVLVFLLANDGASSQGALWFGSTVGMAMIVVLGVSGFYARQLKGQQPITLLGYPKAFLIAVVMIGCFSFLPPASFAIPPDTLLLSVAVGLFGVWPVRSLVVGSLRSRIRAGRLATSRAIVLYDPSQGGEKGAGFDILRALGRSGIDVVHAQPVGAEEEDGAEGLRAVRQACASILRKQRTDAVYVALGDRDHSALKRLQEGLGPLPVPVYVLPADYARTTASDTASWAGEQVYQLQRAPLNQIDMLQKRMFDVVLSALMLLLLAPLFMLVAGAIKLDSPGPVFFRQTRRGLGGRNFRILKFRAMTVLEDGLEIRQAGREDVRVTRLGKSLRQSSIDELPQLLNVLMGQMSLVGPRPHAIAHDDFYGSAIASYAQRHLVKPGLTGWAQVCGHRGATPRLEDMAARIEHDKWYVGNWSFWLDVKIVIRTAFIVFKDNNAY